ncbi:MAG: hypothetical protein LBL82_04620 [Oscillospiraceae bacterium]|nr:hypothetical protein [Oscillospiraceae bacterium]
MREYMPLNYSWRYSPEVKSEYLKTEFQDTSFKLVDIPHTVEREQYSYNNYEDKPILCCYRKMFILPKEFEGRRIILHFEGVMSGAAVFVNGTKAATHVGGYTPFSCDITEYLAEDDNLIAVVVDSSFCTEAVGGEAGFGGIYREVWLEATDEVYIKDVFVKILKNGHSWKLDVSGEINSEIEINYKMYIAEGKKHIATKYFKYTGSKFSYSWELPVSVEEWSIDSPKLYKFIIKLGSGDEKSFNIGFRTVEASPEGILLGGTPVKINGVSRVQSFPYIGVAAPQVMDENDADLIKRLGFNAVRCMYGAHSEHFINRCDQIGILVFEEMSGYGYVGDGDARGQKLENLREMIVRDRNHPSVFMWGTRIRGSYDSDSFYRETAELAASLDGTRPTAGVRDFKMSSMQEDVYCFDDTSGENSRPVLQSRTSVTGGKAPYIVCSHPFAAFSSSSYSKEDAKIKHALRHALLLDAVNADRSIAGSFIPHLSDSGTNGNSAYEDNMSHNGITNAFRERKLASFVYESQRDDTVVMEIASYMSAGDFAEQPPESVYVFTNCDRIDLFRDDSFVKSFFPDRKKFPNLSHAPVLIDDLSGDSFANAEKLSPEDAKVIKEYLLWYAGDEAKLKVQKKAKTAAVLNKCEIDDTRLFELYEKHFSKDTPHSYRFEGIKNGEIVAVGKRSAARKKSLNILVERSKLFHSDSYDLAEIKLMAIDQNGNKLSYCFDGVSVKCDGSIEIAGPELFSLVGGSRVFYVRTKGGKGEAKIHLKTESLGYYLIDLTVERFSKDTLALPDGEEEEGNESPAASEEPEEEKIVVTSIFEDEDDDDSY